MVVLCCLLLLVVDVICVIWLLFNDWCLLLFVGCCSLFAFVGLSLFVVVWCCCLLLLFVVDVACCLMLCGVLCVCWLLLFVVCCVLLGVVCWLVFVCPFFGVCIFRWCVLLRVVVRCSVLFAG